jgi:hypothetical protein
LVGEISQFAIQVDIFGGFLGLARLLIRKGHRPAGSSRRARKGRIQMSSQSPITRTLIAIAAALVMSTVAVGAAVGPAQAVASPSQVTFYV